MRNIIPLTLTAVLLLSGCAGERDRPSPGPPIFKPAIKALMRFDANHDGILTRGELVAGLRARFAHDDTNHDGRLDQDEVRAVNEARWAKEGATVSPLVDWNHDGYVDFTEYAAGPLSLFDELDTNNDGVLSRKELKAAQARPKRRNGAEPGLHRSRREGREPRGGEGGGDGDGD
jgi:hypothetical protein